jgi:putative spermidine/putrescine transport system permease protein/spermidine/putrescine transport system permease protein
VLAPALMPAIGSAAILAFALSFDETLITLLVTGTSSTLPMRLWAMMRMGFSPDINALVALILIGSTLLALLAMRFVGAPARR